MQIIVLNFFLLHEYQVPHRPRFNPIKFCILIQNLQKPTPQNQENFGQLVCSRLANVVYYTNAPYNSEFGQLTTAKISSWKSIFSIWSLCYIHCTADAQTNTFISRNLQPNKNWHTYIKSKLFTYARTQRLYRNIDVQKFSLSSTSKIQNFTGYLSV